MRLLSIATGLALVVGAACFFTGAPIAAASPACTSQVLEDGSLIYAQVFKAKPIRKGPAHIKALLPKRTMGAKMYMYAEKGMTKEYLQRAAACHATSKTTPAYVHDPLRVDGKIRSIRVHGSGGSFVLLVTAEDRTTGEAIWERARALTREVDADLAKRGGTDPEDL